MSDLGRTLSNHSISERWGRRAAFATMASLSFLIASLGMAQGQTGIEQKAQASLPPGIDGVTVDMPRVAPYSLDLDLRKLSPGAPHIDYHPEFEGPRPTLPNDDVSGAGAAQGPAALAGPLAPMPSPVQNFAGLTFSDSCGGQQCGAGWPPDINGDVGPNHYIEAVNNAYAIYAKSGGTLLASFTENQLWASASPATVCNTSSMGDPVVLYDQLADRWVLTHFAFAVSGGNPVAPFYQCIAVSKTSNPVTGGWWLYALRMDPGGTGKPPAGTLNDYPKFGVWHDCLYMSANEFTMPAGTFWGTAFASFSRADMYSGAAVTWSLGTIQNNSNPFTMIPSNLLGKGPNAVPAGTPNYFVSQSQVSYAFEVRKFSPGTNCGGSGALSAPTNVNEASYTVPAATPVTQPGTTNKLDALGFRLMQKAHYRKVGTAESLWVVHTVQNTNGNLSPQWAQIDVTGGTIATTPVQQQIYAPDTTLHRWMGGLAVDAQGNMALGYSTSNGTAPNYPSIAYSGRLATDPLNTLPQTERVLQAGGGSQNLNCGGAACSRWGDYTALSVDPTDDCTFWYTNEYYDTQANGNSGNWHTRIGSFKFPTCVAAPTAATIFDLSAKRYRDGVFVEWRTGMEVRNLGFNLYREEGSQRELVNPSMLAGSALVAEENTALLAGRSYRWLDSMGTTGSRYWLEEIDLDGRSAWHGPLYAENADGRLPEARQPVLLSRLGSYSPSRGTSHPAERRASLPPADDGPASLSRLGPPSAAALSIAGSSMKLSIENEGWYRISQAQLVKAGMDPKQGADRLRLLADGQEMPINVAASKDLADGSFVLEFYATGTESPYSGVRNYWLLGGEAKGKSIPTVNALGSSGVDQSFPYTVERRDRTIYFTRLLNGQAENFFGPVIAGAPVDQLLVLKNLRPDGPAGKLRVVLQGATSGPHRVSVSINNVTAGQVSFQGLAQGVLEVPVAAATLGEGTNVVALARVGGGSDVSLVDTVSVTYPHRMVADGDFIRATLAGQRQVRIDGFTSRAIRIADVTDPANVMFLASRVSAAPGGGFTVSAVLPAGERVILAFADSQARSVAAVSSWQPTNWRTKQHRADLVILSREEYFAALQPLKSLRERQGYAVELVDVEDIYNEFSFGQKTPQAIKDFLSFAVSSWKVAPRFALFAGDASYDPKNYLGHGFLDQVPTRLIDTAQMETASDDWFVDFEGNGLPALAVGRLPLRNAQEASEMVAKILAYESHRPDRKALLVSDLSDTWDFSGASESLRPLLPAAYAVQGLSRDSMNPATARSQILAAINEGPALVNYLGHGSVDVWRASLLTDADVATLTNGGLPVFVMMTCLNGYFAEPALDSLAKALVKKANGGAIAAWASSGITEPQGQDSLNRELFRQLYGDAGAPPTLGEAAARAKRSSPDLDVRRSWVLLGDPTLRVQ